MIYTERDKLAVIESESATDSVSFDVLAQTILERPANIIYCVAKEILYGIISMGDIARAKEEGAESVVINRNFTRLSGAEYMKARRIFSEKENINALPVVGENNVLLGDYTRWGDSIIKQIYGGGVLKTWPDIILVYPCKKLKKKQKSFEYFKKYLLSRGITVKCIQHSEIEQYLGSAVYILFTDEDEMRAMHTLYAYIWDKDLGRTQFFTYRQICGEIRYDFTPEEMNRYILDLCKKGVYFLNLIFECNAGNREYYKKLGRELKAKYDAINQKCANKVYPDMYTEFFDDLYTEKYAKSIACISYQVETGSGLKMLKDCRSEFYNVKNGERATHEQPENFEKTIYFVGPCYIYGHHTEDRCTIESFLQERINKAGYRIRIVNCGSLYSAQNVSFAWMRIKALPLRKGDIIVYGDTRFDGVAQLNLLDICKEHNVPAKWMTNDVRHCNHKINSLYADAVYDALKPYLPMHVNGQGKELQNKENLIKTMYIERYFKDFIPAEHSKTGAIVMNCNPFTYGHRYLIEEALKQTDFLIIFVVEEDRSLFSFDERFTMVCKAVRDLSNVKVVPSGPFILSQTTFPEYFVKVRDDELIENVENDIRIFGEKIAPYLDIKYRFVGEEPEDMVTNEYNLAMKRILPKNGIELIEIPRKELNGKLISASLVRKCLEEQDLEMLEELVPESVREILFERNY